jgi:uncharacterized membrane protein
MVLDVGSISLNQDLAKCRGYYGVLQGCGLIVLLAFLNAILQELAFTFANWAKSVL